MPCENVHVDGLVSDARPADYCTTCEFCAMDEHDPSDYHIDGPVVNALLIRPSDGCGCGCDISRGFI